MQTIEQSRELATKANSLKAMALEAGYCWTLAILSYMYSTERTVCSTIWKESGAMANRWIRNICKYIF